MKTIGLVGGVSWHASAEYYRIINQETQSRLGPDHSAKLVMVSLDFAPVARLEHKRNWSALTAMLTQAITALESAGSDFVLIASNTLHRIAPEVQKNISVPLIHIADAVADVILAENISTVGLLGTNFVMEESFYRDILSNRGIKVIVPRRAERNYVHNVIYHELSAGRVSLDLKQEVLKIIEKLSASGCSAVLLANTELPILIRETDSPTRLFDSLAIHARAGVAFAVDSRNQKKPSEETIGDAVALDRQSSRQDLRNTGGRDSHLASDLGNRYSVILHERTNYLRSHRRQTPPTASAPQFR